MGGENAYRQTVPGLGLGSPPRRRGKATEYPLTRMTDKDHPRMGGEKKQCPLLEDNGVGSPPHGRGKVLTNGLVHGIDGITPARRGKVDVLFWGLVDGRITPAQAGKRGSGLLFHRVWWDHPRVGGEKLKYPKYTTDKGGSPPHGRGKEASIFDDGQRLGITPAWAGKSVPEGARQFVFEDHPRVGGEKR